MPINNELTNSGTETLPTIMEKRSQKKFLHEIMLHFSFNAQRADMLLHSFLKGRIVILLGTSTAGKSTIIQNIQKNRKKNDTRLTVTGTDHIWRMHIYDLFQTYYPDQAQIISHYLSLDEIFFAIWSRKAVELTLKRKNLNENIKTIVRGIMKNFRKEQKNLLPLLDMSKRPYFCAKSFVDDVAQGKTIIVDSSCDDGDIEEVFQALGERLYHCKVDIVIVYCSIGRLLERQLLINKKAIADSSLSNARIGTFLLEQFSKLYKPALNEDEIIDDIKADDFTIPDELPEICYEIATILKNELDGSFQSAAQADDWRTARQSVMNHFKVSDSKPIMIQTTKNFGFFVDTGKNSSLACAELIKSKLKLER